MTWATRGGELIPKEGASGDTPTGEQLEATLNVAREALADKTGHDVLADD